jgi:rubredoxin-NAD+ reductase
MKPVAIIGSGLAGYTVAREFRKLDKTTPVLIITGDDGGFYSKPMLSNAFAQGKTASHLRSQTADQMAAQINATILTRTQVRGIDTTKQTVHTSAGNLNSVNWCWRLARKRYVCRSQATPPIRCCR